MRTRIFKVVMFVTIIFYSTTLHAQVEFQKQGHTSPTAASLGKYGDIPLNSFTGAASATIPLFDVGVSDIKLNLSLSYSASGFKPDERPGWAGSGWSLLAGGMITRAMKGIPDEDDDGYLHTGYDLYEFYDNVVFDNEPSNPFNVYMKDLVDGDKDGEPDVFYYNFMGQTGKFVFSFNENDPNNPIVLTLPYSDLIISPNIHSSPNYNGQFYNYEPIISWTIIDSKGFRYTFSETETTLTVSANENGTENNDTKKRYVSGWYLTEVETPRSSESLRLGYDRHDVYDSTLQKFRHEIIVGLNLSRGFTHHYTQSKKLLYITTPTDSVSFGTIERTDLDTEHRLNRIDLYHRGTLSTSRIFNMSYFGTTSANKRLRLDGLGTIGAAPGDTIWHEMSYHQDLTMPDRESLGKDLWGYYNGENFNLTLFPESSEKDDWGHVIWLNEGRRKTSFQHTRLTMLDKLHYPTGGFSQFTYEPHDYGFVSTDQIYQRTLGEMTTVGFDWYFGMNPSEVDSFTITDTSRVDVSFVCQSFPSSCFHNYPGTVDSIDVRYLPPGTYDHTDFLPTNIVENGTEFDSENEIIFSFYIRPLEWSHARWGGGLRVKAIENSDGMNWTGLRQFDYVVPEDTSRSSGIVVSEPVFNHHHYDMFQCVWQVRSASSVYQLGSLAGSHVGYRYVTTRFSDGSKSIAKMASPYELPEKDQYITSPYGNRFGPALYPDFAYGLPLEQSMYDSVGAMIHQQKTTYYLWIPENHILADLNFEPGTYESDAKSLGVSTQHLGTCESAFAYAYTFYENNYGWIRRNEIVSTTYDAGDILQVRQSFEYDDDRVQHLTKQTEINSNGEQRTTHMHYAYKVYPAMADSNINMLTQLFSTTVKSGSGQKLDSTWTIWSDSLPGNSSWLPQFQRRWTGSNDSITVAEIDTYDQWGNPIEVKHALDTTTRYFFGSNSAPFSQVGLGGVNGLYLTGIQQVIGTADVITGGIRPTGGSVNDLFTEARYNAQGRMDTLIDANGFKTRYAYDGLHRLVGVYNNANEIVSTNVYNQVGSSISSSNPNWIRTANYMSASDSSVSIAYFDGLGRPIQTQMGIGGEAAIVQHTFYDSLGREQAITKPIISETGLDYMSRSALVGSTWQPGDALPTSGSALYNFQNSNGHTSNDSKYSYSQTNYHSDPLNRVSRQTGPGYIWRMGATGGNDRTVRTVFGLNSGSAERFLGFQDGELNKHTVIDANGNYTWTFTDGWGRTIAQVTDLNGNEAVDSGTIDIITRFEYDLLGNLTRVYEPKSYTDTTLIRDYEYDALGRLVSEDSPDIDTLTVYLYDKAGNLRFVRNAEHMRSRGDSLANHNLSYTATTGSTMTFPKNGYLEFSVNFSELYSDEVELRLVKIGSPNRILWSRWFAEWDASVSNIRVPMEYGQYRFEATASYGLDAWSANFSDTRRRYEFQYNKYDVMNRLIESGEYYGDPAHFTQSNADNAGFPTSNERMLVQNYYDVASAHPATPANLKGRLARSRFFDTHSWQFGDTWYSYNVQGLSEWINHKLPGSGSNKRINYSYDRLGNITKTDFQPSVPGERIIFWYTYDQAGRFWRVHSNRVDNFSLAKLDAEYNYTADGQVSQLALGGSFTGGGAQLVDYKYNIRRWLTNINDIALSTHSGFARDRFAMELAYNDSLAVVNGGFTAQFNGNISQVRWKLDSLIISPTDNPAYNYSYDNAGRLTLANFTNTSLGLNEWDVRNITYDKNGNFVSLSRYPNSDTPQALNYAYHTSSNRLKWIEGSTIQFNYDQLGNQISNSTSGRKILSTAYDGRNLPIRMIQTKHSDSGVAQLHRYGYDAAGNRVRKRFLAGSTLWGETGFDYIRGADGAVIAVYNQSGTLLYWNLPGGLGQIIK